MDLWEHLKVVHNHRKWVRYYGKKIGLPFFQRWMHDLSKYSLTELKESVQYFTGRSSPINEAKKDKGYSEAWFHHKGRNKHHYEYWMDNFDNGGENICMPYKYFVEMVADYLAAARTYSGEDEFFYTKELKWWMNKRQHCAMNNSMKKALTEIFFALALEECQLFYSPEFYQSGKGELSSRLIMVAYFSKDDPSIVDFDKEIALFLEAVNGHLY